MKRTMKNKAMKLFALVTLGVIIASGSLPAQSVDSLVNEAFRNNPQLKALEYRKKSAAFRAESASSYPAPTLGIEFSQIPAGKYNPFTDAISNSLSLSQMFMLGGKVKAMSEVERKNELIEGDNYGIYRAALTGQIKMAYYNLWMLERKAEVQAETIKLLNDLAASVNVLYQVNRINQADLLTIKSEIASGETQLMILQKQMESERYKLNKLIGRELESDEVHTVKEMNIDSLALSQPALEDLLTKENPSIQKMNSMIEMNKAMAEANNKDRIPDLMVQAMIMRMPQGMILTSKTDLSMLAMGMPMEAETEYMYSIMASINLPFAPWASGKFKAKEEELYAGIRGIEYERADMQREMLTGLKEAMVKKNTAEESVRLYSERLIPLYRQALEAQVSSYQNGRANINTVIDSNRMLLMQQMNYYMAQADYQMAVAEIEMMVGTRLQR